MPSSYFDAQPANAQPPEVLLDIPKGSNIANTGLLSPQVSRILEDLELGEKSSSDDDNASLSGENSSPDMSTGVDRESRRDIAEQERLRTEETSPVPRDSKRIQTHNKASSNRPGVNGQKQPHFARFHSLRSMLFSNQIEDNMKKHNESKMQEDAEAEWKAQHDSRKALNRPTTPEKPGTSKDGLGQRMKAGLKRMTSKDSPPPMVRIPEDNVSTASDDEEDRSYQSDQEKINHSDVEDLVRWVSKRDPPSDGETRGRKGGDAKPISKTDSGHDSLGHSDVDELVRWVSQPKESRPKEPQSKESEKNLVVPTVTARHGYSDASTESDSEGDGRVPRYKDSMDEDDVDELVRWVSRKEGPNAGPVRKSYVGSGPGTPSDVSGRDSNTDEFVRWVTKHDDASGESLVGPQENSPIISEPAQNPKTAPMPGSRLKQEISPSRPAKNQAATESDAALTSNDVDELVRWVSRKKSDA